MNALKERRQRALAELIRSHALTSQEEVAERLGTLGFAATQATISRDLEQIGALKTRRSGKTSYALPEQVASAKPRGSELARVVREWVHTITPAGNLLVLKTPPGLAHPVGVALDDARLPEIVGTICGDDTLFIAARTAAEAETLAAHLLELASGEGPQPTV
jgi:transcriptional regulator of arginine metabolism